MLRGTKLVRLRKSVVVMRMCMWAPEQNWTKVRRETEWRMEVMLPGAGCPGRAGCPSSGSVDELEEHRVERSNPGKIRKILWMEFGEKMGKS